MIGKFKKIIFEFIQLVLLILFLALIFLLVVYVFYAFMNTHSLRTEAERDFNANCMTSSGDNRFYEPGAIMYNACNSLYEKKNIGPIRAVWRYILADVNGILDDVSGTISRNSKVWIFFVIIGVSSAFVLKYISPIITAITNYFF